MREQRDQEGSTGPGNTRPFGQSAFSNEDWSRVTEALHLSRRESGIVKLVFDDKSDDDIASELAISKHTVNTHLARLYRKLNVHSRIQLVVRICVEHLSLR